MSYEFSGKRPLLNPAVLNRLRQQLGPQDGESRCEVWYPEAEIRSDGGWKKAPPQRQVYNCRLTYIGMLSQKERDVLGIVAQNGQYLVSLPALTPVTKQCQLCIIGFSWKASSLWREGQMITPDADLTTNNIEARRKYRAHFISDSGKGNSGTVEPNWSSGALIPDGDIIWEYQGFAQSMAVNEVMTSTFEVTRRVIGMDRS